MTAFSVISSGSPGPAPTSVISPSERRALASSRLFKGGEIFRARPARAGAKNKVDEALPETATLAGFERAIEALSPIARDAGPVAERSRQQRLELGANGLGKNRGCSVGRDRYDERRAIDDRAEGKIAKLCVVDDVDECAGRARRGAENARFVLVLGSRIATVTPLRSPGFHGREKSDKFLRPATSCFYARARLGGEYARIGAGRSKKFGLPCCADASARHQRRASFEFEKHGQRRNGAMSLSDHTF